MFSRKKILFIINPISGTVNKKGIVEAIHRLVDAQKFEVTIEYTQRAGHGTELAAQAAAAGIDIVAAVGGDGTVNEIGRSLINTDAALYIVPAGSGNGLARHLCIPVDPIKALRHLNTAQPAVIDSCRVNEHPFFCTSGIGFDAFVSHEFARQKKRGLMTYVKTSIRCFGSFKPQTYHLEIDGQPREARAFLITLANAAQYGNNAYICPQADISDGLMDLCIVRPFPAIASLAFAARLFMGNLHRSPFVEIIKARKVTITKPEEFVHLDGEPVVIPGRIDYDITPGNLKVWR